MQDILNMIKMERKLLNRDKSNEKLLQENEQYGEANIKPVPAKFTKAKFKKQACRTRKVKVKDSKNTYLAADSRDLNNEYVDVPGHRELKERVELVRLVEDDIDLETEV